MSEDDGAQLQPEIHDSEPDEPSPTTPIYLLPRPIRLSSHRKKPWSLCINNFTRDYGYALTTARSKRDKGDGEIKVIYLHCDRCGIYRSRINEGHRIRRVRTLVTVPLGQHFAVGRDSITGLWRSPMSSIIMAHHQHISTLHHMDLL
jgi:hypothetical protein